MHITEVAGEKINLRLCGFVDLYFGAVRVRIGHEYLVGLFHQSENGFIFLLPSFGLQVLDNVYRVQTGDQTKAFVWPSGEPFVTRLIAEPKIIQRASMRQNIVFAPNAVHSMVNISNESVVVGSPGGLASLSGPTPPRTRGCSHLPVQRRPYLVSLGILDVLEEAIGYEHLQLLDLVARGKNRILSHEE